MTYEQGPYRRFEDDDILYKSKFDTLPKILAIILLVVVLALIAGSIYGFSLRKSRGQAYRMADPSPEKVINLSKKKSSKLAAYNSIGQMRPVTKPEGSGDSGTLLIVSPWFSYPEGDIQLFEEIAQKDRLIKTIISNYFMSYTKSDLISKGEKKIKEELREQINNQLVLGKINSVYFDQYIFFDSQK